MAGQALVTAARPIHGGRSIFLHILPYHTLTLTSIVALPPTTVEQDASPHTEHASLEEEVRRPSPCPRTHDAVQRMEDRHARAVLSETAAPLMGTSSLLLLLISNR